MEEKKVKVRILPLKGIGGYGNGGDEVWMSTADAEMYIRDGYVEYVDAQKAAPALTPEPSPEGGRKSEDHKIMKPQSKRQKRG